MRIGFTELLVIVVVIMAMIRPDKLIEYSKKIGKALRDVKDEQEKVKEEIIDPVRDEISVVKEPLHEVTKSVDEIKNLI